MKKVVIIGGGTGLSVILRGVKQIPNIKISAIVTVADDGGSTGRLRRQFHIPAMGDIRNVMCALAESETLLSSLMNYRFEGEDDDIGGHNLGNLILTAMAQQSGSFMNAIQEISKVLNVRGTIIPSTEQVITLYAIMQDGTIVRGENNIPKYNNRIERVFYEDDVYASPQALSAIHDADIIIYGIGSLYTSIIPNLIIPGICEELKKSKARKYYICNAMNQPGETDDYYLEDHVEAILNHTYQGAIDTVIAYNNELEQATLNRYIEKGAHEITIRDEQHPYKIIMCDILKFDDGLIRHDSNKIRDIVDHIVRNQEDEYVIHK
ncbi:MAG: uridine diphosphate-N-acetylglucosamine-binding protein YvcK [Erysipelotrichaceae bacterium]